MDTLSKRQIISWTLILTLGLLALRMALVLAHEGYLGVDGGAYLLHTKRLMGLVDVGKIDFQRPILGPGWMLAPFLWAWGDDIGYKIWDAIFSVVPFMPAAALLAFRLLPRRQAFIALIFVALNPWHWEMVITGALPIIGIGFIFLCFWGLIPVLQGKGNVWDKLAIIGSIALIPYINQTSTGLAGVAFPVFVGSYCWITNSWKPIKKVFPYMATGALLAVPAILLFYGDVGFNSDRVSFPGPKIFIPHGIHHGMMVAVFGAVIGWNCLRQGPSPIFKALTMVLLVHSFLPIFYSYDEAIINIFFRSQHLATPLMMILGTWYVSHDLKNVERRKIVHASVAVFAAMLVGVSAFVFVRQAELSDVVTPDYDAARAYIPDKQDQTIITGTFMSGLWLAALEDTQTYWLFSAEPPPIWQSAYVHMQCLLGWIPDCDKAESAQVLNARWILIDTRFPHITEPEPNIWGAPEDTWAAAEEAEWLRLIFSQGTVRLWEIATDV